MAIRLIELIEPGTCEINGAVFNYLDNFMLFGSVKYSDKLYKQGFITRYPSSFVSLLSTEDITFDLIS